MSFIKYIILGIIQGITEPLPISSSAHIIIFKNLFNTNMFNDFNFEIFAHFGSFLALLFIYNKDIINIISSPKKEYKYIINLIISTIPIGIIGFIFKKRIEGIINLKLIGLALIVTAISLFIIRNIKGIKKDKDITIKDALIISLFEVFSLIPGISRSGITLVGTILCNLDHDSSFKYTFLLYFPIALASFILSLFEIGISSSLLVPYLTGTLISFIVTYYSFIWFKNYVKNGNLWKFSIYCIILGIFVLIYFR